MGGVVLEYTDISDMEVREGGGMLLLSDVIVGDAERRWVGTNQNNVECKTQPSKNNTAAVSHSITASSMYL